MARAKNGEEKISKRKLVKQVLDASGNISPAEIQAQLKEQFGQDITIGMASTYKSQFMKTRRGPGRPGRKPASAGTSGPGRKASLNIEDIQSIKGLIDRLGVNELVSMVKLLA